MRGVHRYTQVLKSQESNADRRPGRSIRFMHNAARAAWAEPLIKARGNKSAGANVSPRLLA
ncbi:hypothetical protein SAMN05216597_2732 [Pseudomonas cannabina]|nr:hypothetical protein SAMN05216597_2732 [Pseudomonas cannabina]